MLTSLTVDFDETITDRDTTPLLPRLAAAHLPPQEAKDVFRNWEDGAGRYYARWQEAFENGLKVFSPTPNPCEGLTAFTESFHELEQESLDDAVNKGCLRGIPRSALRETGNTVPKRKDALETLAECQGRGVLLTVISANWSADIVRGGMGDLDAAIHSNNLDFDDRNISTGGLNRRIVSARDKRERYRNVKPSFGRGAYVGDSLTDLLAMCDAEVGILIGDKPRTFQVCEHFGIPVRPISSFESRVAGYESGNSKLPVELYRAESWTEIRAWLESLW